jgi:hypothetical protein
MIASRKPLAPMCTHRLWWRHRPSSASGTGMECYLVCSEFHCEESESSRDGEPAAKRARSSDVESDMDSNQYTPPLFSLSLSLCVSTSVCGVPAHSTSVC